MLFSFDRRNPLISSYTREVFKLEDFILFSGRLDLRGFGIFEAFGVYAGKTRDLFHLFASCLSCMVSVMKSWLGLAASIVLCFAAACLGGLATGRSVDTWYKDLAKPAWTPPGWVFGPVWSLLYMAMAIAAWRVWQAQGLRWPLVLFFVQLLFNAVWSWLFFGLRMPGVACVDVVLLWVAILATTVVFWRADFAAGVLFVPYLLWVTFAMALNFAIWRMNS